jgi:hypothetical protein
MPQKGVFLCSAALRGTQEARKLQNSCQQHAKKHSSALSAKQEAAQTPCSLCTPPLCIRHHQHQWKKGQSQPGLPGMKIYKGILALAQNGLDGPANNEG